MLNLLLASTGAASGAAGGDALGGQLGSLIWFVPLIAMFYFFMIRPQNKRKKQEEAMRNNIEIGDEITTIGGIVGKIVAIKDDADSFIIETGADRSKMKIKKWAIASNDTKKAEPAKK